MEKLDDVRSKIQLMIDCLDNQHDLPSEIVMTPEEFRPAGYRIIDWIADYRAGIESRPVMAKSSPGEIVAQLPASPPQQPESFDAIISDLDRIVLPGITTWQHPRFFGYFPSGGVLSSVLGDYVSSGLGVVGLAWQSSPALTEVEEVTTSWMRQMLGLSDGVERRDQRHRLNEHARGADLRARARLELRTGPRRTAGRIAAARRLRLFAKP